MVKGNVRKCNQRYNNASSYSSWLRFKVCLQHILYSTLGAVVVLILLRLRLATHWMSSSGTGRRTEDWRVESGGYEDAGGWGHSAQGYTGHTWSLVMLTGQDEYLDREGFWFQQQTTQPCPCERRTTINSNNILFCWLTALQCLAQSSYSISILYILILRKYL